MFHTFISLFFRPSLLLSCLLSICRFVDLSILLSLNHSSSLLFDPSTFLPSSIVDPQLSILNYRFSIIDRRFSIVHCPLSIWGLQNFREHLHKQKYFSFPSFLPFIHSIIIFENSKFKNQNSRSSPLCNTRLLVKSSSGNF
jgi:hypothetical protein